MFIYIYIYMYIIHIVYYMYYILRVFLKDQYSRTRATKAARIRDGVKFGVVPGRQEIEKIEP